jgi:hypothetical protein
MAMQGPVQRSSKTNPFRVGTIKKSYLLDTDEEPAPRRQ